jgi:predicted transcriptional regulator
MAQHDLAAESGFTREFISRVENGRIDPRLSTVEALADTSHFPRSVLKVD